MVENPVLSGSIRLEGMQDFASKNQEFCMQKQQQWMDKELSQKYS